MPLPEANTAWPPESLASITSAMAIWDAWWVGDTRQLEKAYGAVAVNRPRPSQMAGGVVGAMARFFWGRPQLNLQQQTTKLHVPIATDICQASADLLWAEAPDIRVGEPVKNGDTLTPNPTQQRLDELIDDQALQVFAEGAEVGAALGGHFLRVTWDDKVVPDRPFLTTVHADAALPVFRWGRLVEVTFWSVVKREGQQVWRHLEHHSLDPFGVGIVEHALYRGRHDNLGDVAPLTDLAATRGLITDERPDGTISTESPGLAVVYVPNQRPQRLWRTHSLGQHLGRSDLDGVEGLMDALDEVYSEWQRDLRNARSRILASESALTDLGAGSGVAFDDRDVFTPLKVAPSSLGGSTASAGLPVEVVQFTLDVERYHATALARIEDILRTAGYSPATFGIGSDGTTMTATEVKARQQRSFGTRDRKLRNVRPAIAQLLEKLLAVDAAVFKTAGVVPERPDIEFPDGVQDSLLTLAQTAQALRTAEAASTETLVRMVHPEWDDEQVTNEVTLIQEQTAVPALPDPTNPLVGSGEDVTAGQPVG
jgi:hypothetical protein